MLKTGNKIFTQWEDRKNKKARYIGPIFREPQFLPEERDADYIFVTVGTREEPFMRLIKGVEELKRKGKIRERGVVHAGHTDFHSDCLDVFDFCTPERIDDLIRNARYVITQESAGIGTQCLKYQKRFLVMPRDYQFGELPAKSDMKEDLHFRLEELGYTRVVNNMEEMEKAIEKIKTLKVGFNFDNSLAIRTIKNIIETEGSRQ